MDDDMIDGVLWNETIPCWACDGIGTVEVAADNIDHWTRWEEEPCNRCGGAGRIKIDGTPVGNLIVELPQ